MSPLETIEKALAEIENYDAVFYTRDAEAATLQSVPRLIAALRKAYPALENYRSYGSEPCHIRGAEDALEQILAALTGEGVYPDKGFPSTPLGPEHGFNYPKQRVDKRKSREEALNKVLGDILYGQLGGHITTVAIGGGPNHGKAIMDAARRLYREEG